MLLAAYIRGRHIDGLSSESPHVSDDDNEFVYSLLCSARFRLVSPPLLDSTRSVLSVADVGRYVGNQDLHVGCNILNQQLAMPRSEYQYKNSRYFHDGYTSQIGKESWPGIGTRRYFAI